MRTPGTPNGKSRRILHPGFLEPSAPFVAKIRGTVSLVALCFVAVLGISLASYIGICTRAMQLSNRSFQASVSKQLAEAGLEEALRAFNQNNWDDWSGGGISVNWTLDTSTKRATATMTFPADTLGQGATASTATVKLRVDNYDANVVGVSWSSSKSYAPGDLVERNGIWYRCLQTHSNISPNGDISHYWVPEFVASTWDSNISYVQQDMVFHAGYWYRCSSSNTNDAPPNTNWVRVNAVNKDSTSGISGVQDAVVNWFGTWYRWNAGSWDSNPPISWRWQSTGLAYGYNDLVNYNNIWYRYISATPTNAGSSYSNPGSDSSRWSLQTNMWLWSSSSINYYPGDTVFYSGRWYRCIRAHTSSSSVPPTNATYWSGTPLHSLGWKSSCRYSQYDTVRHKGVWYLSLQNNNTAQDPSTDTDNSHWIGAVTTNSSYTWSASSSYSVNAYRCYGGVWYKCIAATTANAGHTPNNTAYWTAAWSNSWGVTTGSPVAYAETTINLSGSPAQVSQLRALLAPAPLFPNAVAAATTISANSGGTVDSYDSTRGTYASQTGTATNYSAVVAAKGTTFPAISLSSTAVKGYLAAPAALTSPFAPMYSVGGSASVKGLASPASPNTDLSQISRSPSIPQFDTLPLNPSGGGGGLAATWASVPKGTALALASTINLGTPGASTPARYHHNDNLTLGGGATVTTININGPVILFINGDLTLNGGPNGVININSAGSAEIHVGDSLNVTIGSDGIKNLTLDPKKLTLICDTASSSSQSYSDGGYALYGTIYAPYTTNSTGLYNDNGNVQIYGAISANEITYSGANLNLHYDTSLRHAVIPGVDQPWTVSDWRELPATERATMP
ncbi:MAG: hypothetical protein QG602_2221 [Verrucomicrobiota bacterium]|nr:hypothetical protein [Verrucomicrobiota bacterium]